MNQRFRELAEQAGMVKILNEHAHEYGNGQFENTEYPELEKFAELIVRECMSLMKERKDYYDNPGTYETEKYYIRMDAKADAFDDASSIIKNHFGVE